MNLTRPQLAERIAQDLPAGSFVNLGIGAPTLVSNYITSDAGITLHTENGLLGMGPEPDAGDVDYDLVNAGKVAVTALPGASYFDGADSFGMIRGGHIDICVMGAFQVSETGDLANWSTGRADAIPAVGGAMDLAAGARRIFVMTDLLLKDGTPKILKSCTYPLTALGRVERVYTDQAIFEIDDRGLALRESFTGMTARDFEELIGLRVRNRGE